MTRPADPVDAASLPREQSRWLMAVARVPGRAMACACAAPLCSGLLLIVQAWLLARVLGNVIESDAGAMGAAQWWREFLAMAVLIAVRALLTGWGERAGALASERIKAALRRRLFALMLEGGPEWSRTRASGELAACMLEHVEALDGFFARYLPALVAATLLPLAFAVALMPVDVVAGLLLLVTAPLIPVFMALVGWGAQAAGRRHARAMSRLAGFFTDRLRGAATLKMFGREQAETAIVADAAVGIAQRTQAVLRIAFLSSAVLEFFAALGVAGMAVYFGLSFLGFLDLRSDPLTLQVGLFCLLMAPEAYAPLRQFAAHYHDRGTAQAAVAELTRVFGHRPDPRELRTDLAAEMQAGESPTSLQLPSDPALQISHASHAIQASHASQASHENEVGQATQAIQAVQATLAVGHRLIGQIDWNVQPGERVALMGESGVGKTTLLETLAGLRDGVRQGSVQLFGRPLSQWSRQALCERVAYISQRPYLFEGTLAENIRLGCAQASDAAVRAAADRACVTEFADAWPQGLATRLGARGQGLSGGQAHRVALARLYLRDPALVLVDEPTAHLDDATGARVLDGLLAWCESRTLIMVTHSQSAAQRCERRLHLSVHGLRDLCEEGA